VKRAFIILAVEWSSSFSSWPCWIHL